MTMPPLGGQVALALRGGPPAPRRPPTPPRPRRRPPGRARRRCDRRRRRATRDRRPVASGRELDLGDEGDEALRVVDRHAAGLGQPGHGAVQQPGVAEPVADLARGGRARRCSCPTMPGPSRATTSRGHQVPRRPGAARDRPPAPRPRTSGALSARTLAAAQPIDADGADAHPDEPLRPARRPRRTSGAAGASSPGSASPGTRSAGRGGGRQQVRPAVRPRSPVIGRSRPSVARPSSSSMPACRAATWSRVERRREAQRVLALDAVARVQDPLGPAAVVGQQEHPLGVLVEPADRVQPGAVGHERRRDEVEHGRGGVAVARRRGHARPACAGRGRPAPRPRR